MAATPDLAKALGLRQSTPAAAGSQAQSTGGGRQGKAGQDSPTSPLLRFQGFDEVRLFVTWVWMSARQLAFEDCADTSTPCEVHHAQQPETGLIIQRILPGASSQAKAFLQCYTQPPSAYLQPILHIGQRGCSILCTSAP